MAKKRQIVSWIYNTKKNRKLDPNLLVNLLGTFFSVVVVVAATYQNIKLNESNQNFQRQLLIEKKRNDLAEKFEKEFKRCLSVLDDYYKTVRTYNVCNFTGCETDDVNREMNEREHKHYKDISDSLSSLKLYCSSNKLSCDALVNEVFRARYMMREQYMAVLMGKKLPLEQVGYDQLELMDKMDKLFRKIRPVVAPQFLTPTPKKD